MCNLWKCFKIKPSAFWVITSGQGIPCRLIDLAVYCCWCQVCSPLAQLLSNYCFLKKSLERYPSLSFWATCIKQKVVSLLHVLCKIFIYVCFYHTKDIVLVHNVLLLLIIWNSQWDVSVIYIIITYLYFLFVMLLMDVGNLILSSSSTFIYWYRYLLNIIADLTDGLCESSNTCILHDISKSF